jgi:S1-C subfamily serine protease
MLTEEPLDSNRDVPIEVSESTESTTHAVPTPNFPNTAETIKPGVYSPTATGMFLSTLLSLSVVVVLLITIRWVLPPLLESSRYSWYRGQLRAQHEAAGLELQHVSLDGLSRISELVSQRVTPSVVHINIKNTPAAESLEELLSEADPALTDRLKQGQGSGVLVDQEGYIITNYHVLEDGEVIEVRMSDDARHTARMIGFDPDRDIAVLKIDKTDLPAIDWGNSDTCAVGSPVWAVGSPFGLTGSITFGILSSKHRVDLSDSRYQLSSGLSPDSSDLMQSDVAINPGNSGGPLVNGRGELVGINTAILGPTYRGVSFSIPSNLARVVYDSILTKSKTTSGWLGVMLRDGSGAAVVQDFARPGPSPAREAGLQIGDVILKFEGKKITGFRQLIETITGRKAGEIITVDLERAGRLVQLEVELGPRPVINSAVH